MRRTPMTISGLYAILDLPQRDGLDPLAVIAAMLEGGARVVQLRSKRAPFEPALVGELARLCAAANVPMIINDELELAEQIPGAAGIHLGQTDLARLGPDTPARVRRRERLRARGLRLGISTHDLQQLRAAIDELAPDYVGYGPVFSTGTKTDHDPIVGLAGLAQACAIASLSNVPVVAIGGIDLERVPAVRSAGASAVAVIGALTGPSVEIIRANSFALARALA